MLLIGFSCHTSLSCNCIQLYNHAKVANRVEPLTVLSPQDRIVTSLDTHAIGVLHTHILHQLMDTATIPTPLSTAPPQVKKRFNIRYIIHEAITVFEPRPCII